jgi:hypothetical protein
MTQCFTPVYDKIWDKQSSGKIFLFDLARDGYSNYKNADIIFNLMTKGILIRQNFRIRFFSLSFRNYILGKKDTMKSKLQEKFSPGGMWQSIRTPFLTIVAGLVFFHRHPDRRSLTLTAFITSIAALAIILQLITKGFSKKTLRGFYKNSTLMNQNLFFYYFIFCTSSKQTGHFCVSDNVSFFVIIYI